jgi:hypothetical protein
MCSKDRCVDEHHRDHVLKLVRRPPAVEAGSEAAELIAAQQWRVNGIVARQRQARIRQEPLVPKGVVPPWEYLVSWEGDYENSWETAANLNNPTLVAAADARLGRRGRKRRKIEADGT